MKTASAPDNWKNVVTLSCIKKNVGSALEYLENASGTSRSDGVKHGLWMLNECELNAKVSD